MINPTVAPLALPATPAAAPSARGALAGLSLAMLLASLGTSIANVALPTLATVFAASFQQAQWIVLAYLLAITTLIVGVGRLGDLLGRRRLLLVGIGLFTVASGLGGAAPGLVWLIAARAAQGVGAALLMALSLAMVSETVAKEKIGSAMGLLGTMSAIGTALGPSLGGLLIAAFGWRAIFFVKLPLGLMAWLLAHRYLPADRPAPRASRPSFDLAGTLALAATLAAYALAMTLGRGHFGPLNLALVALALGGGLVFVATERRAAAPLINLAIFADPALRASLATSLLVATVAMTTLVVGPFYLTRGLGLGPAAAGLALAAGPIVSALTGVPAGRLVDRLGARRITFVGLGALAAGCASLAALPLRFGLAFYLAAIVVVTSGYALFQAANNTAVMTEVSPEQRGVLSGLLNLSRNLGLVTGAAVLAAIFAAAAATSDIATAPPEAVEKGMHVTFAVAASLILAAIGLATAAAGRATGVWPLLSRPSLRAPRG